LIAREKALARRLGATHHDEADGQRPWRKLVEDEAGYTAHKQLAMQRIAELIREQVLAPGGQPPRGSIYLHCGGGMHRSGMVFGILRRCINRDPLSLIEAEYKRHTVYVSAAEHGGYEELNLRLIREFDCGLLGGAAR
jgi:protein-tyrosine phosphatase